MNTQKRTISAREAARVLGTSQMMVKEMVKRGIVPGDIVSIGKQDRIIIPRAKFEAYLGEKTEQKGVTNEN